MEKENIELACSIIGLPSHFLTKIDSKRQLNDAYEVRIGKCAPSPSGGIHTTEYNAVQAAYKTLIGYCKVVIPKREDNPEYKVNLSKSAALFDNSTFNALFEASKSETARQIPQCRNTGSVSAMESSPSLANVLKIKVGADQNIHVLRNSHKPTSNNNHYSVREFTTEANRTIVLPQIDRERVQQYTRDLTNGTQRLVESQLKQKAQQFQDIQRTNFIPRLR